MTRSLPWLRSMLYAPGDSDRLLEKVFTAGADSVILDLEDAVTLANKAKARTMIAARLAQHRSLLPLPVFVRVNTFVSHLLEDDIKEVVRPGLTGVKLPKVQSGDEVRWLDDRLAQAEKAAGLPSGEIWIMPGIESAAGIEAAVDIARASSRVWCLSFGAEDFAADIGCEPTAEAWESFYARSRLVIASRVAGIAPPFDTVYPPLDSPDALRINTMASKRLGYQGKSAVHPKQLQIIHEIYTPTPRDVAQAQKVIAAFRSNEAQERAAFQLDGSLIDYAMVRRAEQLLARSEIEAKR